MAFHSNHMLLFSLKFGETNATDKQSTNNIHIILFRIFYLLTSIGFLTWEKELHSMGPRHYRWTRGRRRRRELLWVGELSAILNERSGLGKVYTHHKLNHRSHRNLQPLIWAFILEVRCVTPRSYTERRYTYLAMSGLRVS